MFNRKNFVEWQSKQAQASYMAEIIQNLIRDDEREIEIDMKLLNEKKEELQNYVMELTKDLSVHRPQVKNLQSKSSWKMKEK